MKDFLTLHLQRSMDPKLNTDACIFFLDIINSRWINSLAQLLLKTFLSRIVLGLFVIFKLLNKIPTWLRLFSPPSIPTPSLPLLLWCVSLLQTKESKIRNEEAIALSAPYKMSVFTNLPFYNPGARKEQEFGK